MNVLGGVVKLTMFPFEGLNIKITILDSHSDRRIDVFWNIDRLKRIFTNARIATVYCYFT